MDQTVTLSKSALEHIVCMGLASTFEGLIAGADFGAIDAYWTGCDPRPCIEIGTILRSILDADKCQGIRANNTDLTSTACSSGARCVIEPGNGWYEVYKLDQIKVSCREVIERTLDAARHWGRDTYDAGYWAGQAAAALQYHVVEELSRLAFNLSDSIQYDKGSDEYKEAYHSGQADWMASHVTSCDLVA